MARGLSEVRIRTELVLNHLLRIDSSKEEEAIMYYPLETESVLQLSALRRASVDASSPLLTKRRRRSQTF